MTTRHLHIILLSLVFVLSQIELVGQSTSFGNTFVHNDGESVIFGMHDFATGGGGVLPGMIGTQRTTDGHHYGIVGFSDISPGWKGIGNDSYVDGYVKKYGAQPFVFPIGDNGKYRPIAIDGGEGTTACYYKADPGVAVTSTLFGNDYVALPQGGPFPQSSKNDVIVNISDIEYWDIDGTSPTKVTLTWDIFSNIDLVTNDDLSKLTILGWDGNRWQIIPSKLDILYLNTTRSRPLYNGGVSSNVRGSISTIGEIVPNDYQAYTFGSIASGTIGDFAWEDLNRNGIQEIGEPGIEGVKIELFVNQNDSLMMTTTTDRYGQYAFVGVPPGEYYLRFTPGSTYATTLTNQGIQALNSDLIFNNTTPPFELGINQSLFGMDGGFYRTGSIGNLVWLDTNRDGIQDSDEDGMAAVKVELLSADAVVTAATVTSADGTYTFTNLPPGEYMIRVEPPEGYNIGPYKATLDEDRDSDIDPFTMYSEVQRLTSGQEIENVDAALSNQCEYTAEVDIVSPDCGIANGRISASIMGQSGPYTYEWNTGSSLPYIENVDTGHYTLLIRDSEGCQRAFNIEVTYEVDCEMICADLDAHVFLEGAFMYDDLAMHKTLNELGYLPGQRPTAFFATYTDAGQPYNEEPWYMAGTEGMTFESQSPVENNLYYDFDVVDWVLVSLRTRVDVEYETCTRAGMLHQDGHISFVEDDCCLVDPTREYYIVIEHRNHLIVMSPTALPVVDGKIKFDFRTNQSYTRLLGNGQKEIAPGMFAMYAANGDQYSSLGSSVDINVGDVSEWLRENGMHSSYYRHDFDLNGDTNVQDKGLYLRNIGVFTDVPKGN